jgi:protein-disulfide isomerase
MKALMENKLVAGTVMAVMLFIGLFGVWKMLNGNAPTTQTDVTIDLKIDETDWQKGSASPSATLVEYSDFQCPACKAYAPIVKAFTDKHKDTVKLVYRHFPLQQHKHALKAAYYAEAAGMQGKFFEMHDKLFEGQTDWEKLSNPDETFVSYAKELKLDIEKLKKDVASQNAKDSVSADMASGNAAGVDSTPTFYFNGKKLISPQSLDDFEKLLK